ncbi:hypothetical protein HMPREF9019_0882 [Hoylesella timonensis CRIS 5C-B1]|uniref:Uncharacterized protein n=1 Tax=Hoylesella timonensis CRIS 5C-B1 TaxID=679189 RepID=D1VX30_9BACT|nr:hypothetical protein HMPREF9019_0882 [Hoylesella timonensis CRIS 5C-B1]
MECLFTVLYQHSSLGSGDSSHSQLFKNPLKAKSQLTKGLALFGWMLLLFCLIVAVLANRLVIATEERGHAAPHGFSLIKSFVVQQSCFFVLTTN